MNDTNTMRTRVIRVLILLAIASTFLPWSTGDGPSTGLASGDGLVAAIAAATGLFLHVLRMRFAWIGPAFAAVAMFDVASDERAASTPVPLVGAVVAAVAAVLMMVQIVREIRANAPQDEA